MEGGPREIRSVLTHLVTNMPGVPNRTRPGTALQAARIYLHGHCAECGATLERHYYALVISMSLPVVPDVTIGNHLLQRIWLEARACAVSMLECQDKEARELRQQHSATQ
jgi:hypothetical protein